MSDGVIKVDEPASPTKQLDTTELTVGANTVERERVQVAGAGAAELADVRNSTPSGSDYGVVTRPIPSGTQTVTGSVTLGAAVPAGTNLIGKVGVDQTTPGTTNNVSVDTATGAGATVGATTDVAATAGGAGTLSAKLRAISRDIVANIVLAAGSSIIGKVGFDQTTPGTTESVTVATGQGAGATIGTTSGAAVITDANGTIQQYLRGIVKLLISTITVSVSNFPASLVPSRYDSTALEASHAIKASAGTLYWLTVHNEGLVDQWYALADQSSVPTGAFGANKALYPLKILAGKTDGWSFGDVGLPMANGIAVYNSTTDPTGGSGITAGSSDSTFNAAFV